jgi:hypothetical protein
VTTATPVERIVAFLTAAHFRRVPTPIVIAGVKFDFAAVLVGIESMPDLVIVADTTLERDDRVRTKLEGVARALDVVRSKRPLTLILAGPRPRTAMLDAMAKVCRVLPVGALTSDGGEAALKNWLAVLMPLTLPQVSDAISDPMRDLVQETVADDPIGSELLAAAPQGAPAVKGAFHRLVQQPLDAAELDPK